MSQIIDRATLITEFEAYMKRTFATDRQDTFIQLTHDRVFRDLRAQENLRKTTLLPTDVLIDLPDDYIDAREISYLNGSRRIVLSSVYIVGWQIYQHIGRYQRGFSQVLLRPEITEHPIMR